MNRKWNWTSKRFGRKLLLLHRWHAIMFLFLALSGILLSIGMIRGELGIVRVWMKQLHILIGGGTIAVLVAYTPLIRKHLNTLSKLPKQRYNLVIVLFLIIGWIFSGIL